MSNTKGSRSLWMSLWQSSVGETFHNNKKCDLYVNEGDARPTDKFICTNNNNNNNTATAVCIWYHLPFDFCLSYANPFCDQFIVSYNNMALAVFCVCTLGRFVGSSHSLSHSIYHHRTIVIIFHSASSSMSLSLSSSSSSSSSSKQIYIHAIKFYGV